MKRFLATVGVAMLMITAAAAATNAADNTEIKAEVTKATSLSRQTSSEVNVGGTWAVDKLAVGQSFTVASKDGGFKWNASFPFTLDDGTVVGECAADQATLACKVTEIPESYKDKTNVKGTWWARARLQDAAVGTSEGTITLNGEVVKKLVWGDAEGTGTCTVDCDSPAHYEYAKLENIKFGWTNDNGTVGWGIKFIVTPGTEYTVKDFDTRLNTAVKCAKSDTWNPVTTENITATQVDENTIKFTAPADSKVCITYPPEQMKVPEGQSSVTNHAEVNGMKLEATATIKANGGTDGNGAVKPQPAPVPTPDTNMPTPGPAPSPLPKPSPKPTPSEEPKPTPTPEAPQSDPTPEPRVTTSPVPVPSEKPTPKPTPTAVESMNKPTVQNTKKDRLAKTGTDFQTFVVIGIVGGLAGTAALTVSWCAGRRGRDHI